MPAAWLVRLPYLTPAVLLIGSSGCLRGHQPPPFQPPNPAVYVDHFTGEPLSGAVAQPVAISNPEDALDIRVELSALERMPASVGHPLGASARLLVATRGLEPVRPSAKLTGEVRVIDPNPGTDWQSQGEFGRIAPLRQSLGALPEGATMRVAVVAGTSWWELMVSRPTGAASPLQIAVAREADFQPPREPAEESGPSTRPAPPAIEQPSVRVREIALLDRPSVPTADRLCILLPLHMADSPAQGLAVVFDIRPGNAEAEHVQAVESARNDLKRAAERVASRPERLAIGSAEGPVLQTAMRALADAEARRAALVYLAGQTGAHLCEETAMVADETLLARLAEAISARGAALWLTPDALGWQMERIAFELHAELIAAGKLPPELSAVLVSFAGEAGRNAASVEEVGKSLASRAEFETRLVSENMIFLEDSSPASRVRAFDWLASRGRAPAGYDPLGPARQRRDALERTLHAAPATVPAGGQS